ncbi:carbohydrate ABC transporter permease [Alicyclobacillus fodiniaquatilis]|uniref:Carbohydrate ABC transporter permease n=1 Tax=Alicyclobacillus fodiniaquatilis TaxID=1661150 RepID=A0ABW4JP55_9BACL
MALRLRGLALHIILVMLGICTLFPIFYMLVNSLKTGVQTAQNPWWFTSWHLDWANYKLALQATLSSYTTSIIITVVSVVLTLAFAALSAYAFARLHFIGKEVLFIVIFALLLVPGFLTLIPLFIEIKNLHLLNSDWGLIFPYVAGGQAFAILVLRSFFQSLPQDLFESARIDGAGDIRIFWNIVIPLSFPILVTLALMNVINIWSDFILPSLVLNGSAETLAVAIVNFHAPALAPSANAFNIQLAAFTLSAIPLAILFSFLMRYFVRGITSGAIKM